MGQLASGLLRWTVRCRSRGLLDLHATSKFPSFRCGLLSHHGQYIACLNYNKHSLTSYPVGFSGMILWWVRVLNDFEVNSEHIISRATFLHVFLCFFRQQVKRTLSIFKYAGSAYRRNLQLGAYALVHQHRTGTKTDQAGYPPGILASKW